MTTDPDIRRFLFALAFFVACVGVIAGLLTLGLFH